MTAVIHIAGIHVTIGGRYLRQRCAWCGATLIDSDLTMMAVPEGQDFAPPVWPEGGLVAVDGRMNYTVEHNEGDQLPEGACGRLDPAVTR